MLGVLQLDDVWRDDLAPDVKGSVSAAAFSLIDDTVRKVLGEKQLFWVTAGAALAVWEGSGAVRTAMGAIDEVYAGEDARSTGGKLGRSIVLAVAVGLCIVGALVAVRFGPLLHGEISGAAAALSFVARWLVAVLLLGLAVGLLVHYAPRVDQPLPWVSFGAVLVLVGWIAMSVGFGIYVSRIASYGSIFGHLATFFVLLLYLYEAAVVFVGGVQVDAVVRRRAGA